MEKAYLRKLKYTNQCELAFSVSLSKGNQKLKTLTEIRSVRGYTDVIESLLTHTERSVAKILELEDEIKASLTVNGIDVKGDVNCNDFIENIKGNIVFTILNQRYKVIINAPVVQELVLPKVIHINYELQPIKFKTLYTIKNRSHFIWYSSMDQVVWTQIGKSFRYKPNERDLDKYLKLKCIPKNEITEGPCFEVISESTISKVCEIPTCPFEKRHEQTKTFLLEKERFRVVSYNILSKLYAETIPHPPECPQHVLSINYRKQLILKELLGYNADIICLQEVDLHIFSSYLKPKLSKIYTGLFYKKGFRIPEGLACFFNKERFKLLETNQLVFCQELGTNPLFIGIWNNVKQYDALKECLFKQKTSLQITVLRSKQLNEIIIVANTHLYYHPDASQVRLVQTNIALEYIEELCRKYNNYNRSRTSVLFCGDFNSVPTSAVYEFITKGRIEVNFQMENETSVPICLSHPFKFASACGIPEYTNYSLDFKGCLDYIFYQHNHLQVLESVPLPNESILAEKTALPSEVFPSDHLALISTLKWK